MAPLRWGEGGRRPIASPVNHAGRRSHLQSSSTAGRLDLCIAPSASTSGGVDIVDDLRRPHLQSSSAAGRPDLCAAPGASTSGDVDIVDDLQCSPLRSSSALGRPDLRAVPDASTTDVVATVDELLELAVAGSLLLHHDDGSSCGHRLGHRFRRIQPHHFQCQ
jgi:hypothetical protein